MCRRELEHDSIGCQDGIFLTEIHFLQICWVDSVCIYLTRPVLRTSYTIIYQLNHGLKQLIRHMPCPPNLSSTQSAHNESADRAAHWLAQERVTNTRYSKGLDHAIENRVWALLSLLGRCQYSNFIFHVKNARWDGWLWAPSVWKLNKWLRRSHHPFRGKTLYIYTSAVDEVEPNHIYTSIYLAEREPVLRLKTCYIFIPSLETICSSLEDGYGKRLPL